MAEKMAETAGGQLGWSQMAEGMALRDACRARCRLGRRAGRDAPRQRRRAVGRGSNAGGAGQPAIKVVGDVTRAGYNLVNGRGVTDTSSIAPASCQPVVPDLDVAAAASSGPRVLGEKEQRTCDACTKTETVPGVG
jgi:hypothetical protein